MPIVVYPSNLIYSLGSVSYNICKQSRSEPGKHWCATVLKPDKTYASWDYCTVRCPLQGKAVEEEGGVGMVAFRKLCRGKRRQLHLPLQIW